jgi:hypothetical protein
VPGTPSLRLLVDPSATALSIPGFPEGGSPLRHPHHRQRRG